MTGTIIVAGAGIGGLMAALTLARSGYDVQVLERAEAFGEIGAGLQLGPNATRILARWDLLDSLSTDMAEPREICIMDAMSGKRLAVIPLGDRFVQRFGAPYRVIHRADLHRALLEACEVAPGIALESGRDVTGFDARTDAVTVQCAGGAHYEADALIGADGLRSAVRAGLLADGPPRFADHTAYRTLVPAEAMPAGSALNASVLWAGPRFHVVHYPLRSGQVFNLVAICADGWRGENWTEQAGTEEVLRQFSGACPALQDLLRAGPDYRKWALADRRPAARWSQGRVTLLGDAAHPVLPYLAQGAAMAIEDADCLAACLSRAEGAFEAAFRTYEAARRPRTARLARASRGQAGVYHARGIKRLARDLFMRYQTPEQWYNRLDWIYSGP